MLLLAMGLALFVFFSNYWILETSEALVFDDVERLPANNVGLLLGTAEYVSGGRPNSFFEYRMDAAAFLYKKGKIRHIIVSGDNHRKSYDEPTAMKNALIKRGVPAEAVTEDFAGFRTLDSVVRTAKIFGQQKFTIISQPFHNYRAIFIGRAHNYDVLAFNARKVSARNSLRANIREYFARALAVLDIYLLRRQPRYLGKKETILSEIQ